MKMLRSRVWLLVLGFSLVCVLGCLFVRGTRDPEGRGGLPVGIVVTLAVMAGLVVWMQRSSGTGSGSGESRLKCRETLRLGNGKTLHLIEADGETLLLASWQTGVQVVASNANELSSRTDTQNEART